ncbi:putative ABC transport system permease protein, partial [Aduncisulcus paluster]
MLVSIAFIVAVTGMASTFTNGLLGYMKKSMSSDYLILQDAMILGSEGGVGADESLSRKIRNIDGVLEITEIRQSDAKAGTIPLSMIGIDVDSYKSLSGLTFLDGNEEKAYE